MFYPKGITNVTFRGLALRHSKRPTVETLGFVTSSRWKLAPYQILWCHTLNLIILGRTENINEEIKDWSGFRTMSVFFLILIKWDFLFNFSFANLKFSVSPHPCNLANYGGDCTPFGLFCFPNAESDEMWYFAFFIKKSACERWK